MPDTAVALSPALGILLLVLALAAALLIRVAGLGRARDVLIACGRAAVQLAAVSAIIGVVVTSLGLTAGFVLMMLVIAAGTSAHRISHSIAPRHWWTAAAIGLPVVLTLTLIVVSTAVPLAPIAVLPIAGIIIGNAMTATSLAGRRATEELHARRGEYDAARSLGMSRHDAVQLIGRPAAALALYPGLDQTKTVGLVTLPGAFVGVLLAGASPVQAGTAQLLVLVSLVLVQTAAVTLTVELVGRGLIVGYEGELPE